MRLHLVGSFLVTLLLSAATSGSALAAEPELAAGTASLRKQCIAYGYKAGTDALAECVMKLDLLRAGSQKAPSGVLETAAPRILKPNSVSENNSAVSATTTEKRKPTPIAEPPRGAINTIRPPLPSSAPRPAKTDVQLATPKLPEVEKLAAEEAAPPIVSLVELDETKPLMPPYPQELIGKQRQPVTALVIWIAKNVGVTACNVDISSGLKELDEAACEHVKRFSGLKSNSTLAVGTRLNFYWDLQKTGCDLGQCERPIKNLTNTDVVLTPILSTRVVSLPTEKNWLGVDQPIPWPTTKGATSRLLVTIGVQGNATECSINVSSGYDFFDKASCDQVIQKWRWQPPTIGGRISPVRVLVDYHWGTSAPILRPIFDTQTPPLYPERLRRTRASGTTSLNITIGYNGNVIKCVVIASSGFLSLDSAACPHVKDHWRWEPITILGRPAEWLIRIPIRWDPRSAP